MANEGAELDSATTTIDDVIQRVTSIADHHQEFGDESVASDLYDVERALRSASRKLAAVVRQLQS